MKIVKSLKITTLHERSVRIRVSHVHRSIRCGKCLDGQMVNPETAAVFTLQTTRTIYRLVEEGRVHYAEDPGGLLICLKSLAGT